jgi:hypothetical protein
MTLTLRTDSDLIAARLEQPGLRPAVLDRFPSESRPPARPASSAAPRPILVTGSHRSGSTWIGTVLALDAGAGYIPEPFNRGGRKGICRAHFPYTYMHLHDGNAGAYRDALADTLGWRYGLAPEIARLRSSRDAGRMLRDYAYFQAMRLGGRRPVMKDPIALFSADWLATAFDMQVLVSIRHPAAFVASLKVANWTRFPFRHLLEQERLMEERLAPFRDAIAAAAAVQPDEIDGGILLWRIFHHQIAAYREAHPDWLFLRHEDLSADPEAGFRAVYAVLGLDFTPAVARGLARLSSGSAGGLAGRLRDRTQVLHPRRVTRDSRRNLASWKRRLAPAEIARIRRGTEAIAAQFYTDADW